MTASGTYIVKGGTVELGNTHVNGSLVSDKTIVINEAGNATATSTGHGLTIQSGAFALKIGDDNIDAYNPVAGTGRTLFLNQNSDGTVAVGNNVPITAAKSVTTKEYVDALHATSTTAPGLSGIASGWSVTVTSCVRRAGWAALTLTPIPTAAWQTSASGNVTDLQICTVASGFRPADDAHCTSKNGLIAATLAESNGNVYLTATAGGIAADASTIRLQFIYPLA